MTIATFNEDKVLKSFVINLFKVINFWRLKECKLKLKCVTDLFRQKSLPIGQCKFNFSNFLNSLDFSITKCPFHELVIQFIINSTWSVAIFILQISANFSKNPNANAKKSLTKFAPNNLWTQNS